MSRFVSIRKTHKGTVYEHLSYFSGQLDVIVEGVLFRNLTAEEFTYFHFNF